jgi:ectoine hydroxylase-related dioxygenase (phytanoyl-CoA dioxygenase family)
MFPMHPLLDEPYPLTADQRAAFDRDGHLLLPQVATAAVLAHYGPALQRAAYAYNTETRRLEDRDTYGRAFLQIMNLWRVEAAVQAFVFARRFARLAAGLLGVDRVRLYHDQALFKEPGGGPTPWHQDQYYWPLDTDRTITLWMPLVDITDGMGMLTFASGSHRGGLVEDFAISDASEAFFADYVARHGFPVTRPATMQAGDATFHLGTTLHAAPGNHSATTRAVMTIIYFADGACVAPPRNPHQENDRQTWLDGLPPGHPATGPLNPVLG